MGWGGGGGVCLHHAPRAHALFLEHALVEHLPRARTHARTHKQTNKQTSLLSTLLLMNTARVRGRTRPRVSRAREPVQTRGSICTDGLAERALPYLPLKALFPPSRPSAHFPPSSDRDAKRQARKRRGRGGAGCDAHLEREELSSLAVLDQLHLEALRFRCAGARSYWEGTAIARVSSRKGSRLELPCQTSPFRGREAPRTG